MEQSICYKQGNQDIDIILPCFNPGKNWEQVIVEHISRLKDLLPEKSIHLVIVDDGSECNMEPGNEDFIRQSIPGTVILHHPVNFGKGEAIRTGLKSATSPFMIYTDWDFPYELEGIRKIVQQLESGYDIVVVARTDSYRHHKELTWTRKVMSASSRVLNKWILGLKFNDTQGGLKGINAKGREILLQTQIKRFLFDTEFIYKASRLKDIRICETAVNVRQGIHLSFMGFKVLRREFFNFIKIVIQTNIKWQPKK